MTNPAEMIKLKSPVGGEFEVSKGHYDAAKAELSGYKKRNPFDRFQVRESQIVATIAWEYNRDNEVTDKRALIGCFVKVGGKGWTSR